MKLIICPLQFIALLFLTFNLIGSAAKGSDVTLDSQKMALDIIADFAERLCKSVPAEGNTQNIELSGDVKADLNGVLKVIADLGLQGAIKYQDSKYRGVLQKDLAGLVRDSTTCKKMVWIDLKDKLIPEAPSQGFRPLGVEMTKDGKPHIPNYIKGSR